MLKHNQLQKLNLIHSVCFRDFDSGLFPIIVSFCQNFSLDNKYFILVECKFLFNELFKGAGKEFYKFFLYSTAFLFSIFSYSIFQHLSFCSNLVILCKRESNIQNLSINYCIVDPRKHNLIDVGHDLFFAVMHLVLSE